MAQEEPALARKIGLLALFQALLDDRTVRAYLRAIYLGLSGVIAGSVLVGAALAVALIAFYRTLIAESATVMGAALATGAIGLLVTVTCFALGAWWFSQLTRMPERLVLPDDSVDRFVSMLLVSLAEGFMEGLTSPSKPEETVHANLNGAGNGADIHAGSSHSRT